MLAARSEKRLEEIVNEIRAGNYEASFIKTDVSRETDCKTLVEKTVEKYGTVNILINNAGITMRASTNVVSFL